MTLKELKQPAKETDPVLIFVHGILSNAESCWTNKPGISWPQIVRRDPLFHNCGIYTYTYPTAATRASFSITDAADVLWDYLKNADMVRPGRLPLFVCHSMGGIIVRRMLVKRQNELSDNGVNLVGLVLVASPSMGSRWAWWLSPIARLMGHIQAMTLSSSDKNIWLHDLKGDFRNLCDNGPIRIFGKELLEDLPLALKWVPWLPPIVRSVEGAVFFADPVKVPDTDHFTVAKPANARAFQHISLRNFVVDFRKLVSMHCFVIPAGATFAQAMYGAGKSLNLDVNWDALTQSELETASAVDRQVSGASMEDMLEAIAAAFPAGAIRGYTVTIRGTTAVLSIP